MKTRHYLIFTLITFVMFSLVSHGFSQANSPEYVVKTIYFYPKDAEPQFDIDAVLNAKMKEAQTFFADEMERHGFGRKTFRLETDEQGNTKVHHLKGSKNSSYYTGTNTFDVAGKFQPEIFEEFINSNDILCVFVHAGVNYIGGIGGWNPLLMVSLKSSSASNTI